MAILSSTAQLYRKDIFVLMGFFILTLMEDGMPFMLFLKLQSAFFADILEF
jgi:hypothetical protein